MRLQLMHAPSLLVWTTAFAAIFIVGCVAAGSSQTVAANDGGTHASDPDPGPFPSPEGGRADSGEARGVGRVQIDRDGDMFAYFTQHEPETPSETFGEHCRLYIGTDPKIVLVGAGMLTVKGGGFPADGFSVSPIPEGDDMGRYRGLSGVSSAWTKAGEMLTLTASGGEVPAFDTSVASPSSDVRITQPPIVEATKLSMTRAADVPARWTTGGTNIGHVAVTLVHSTAKRSLHCIWPLAKADAVIPRAALQQLPAGPAVFVAGVANTEKVAAGSFDVEVSLTTDARDAGGRTLFPAAMVFE